MEFSHDKLTVKDLKDAFNVIAFCKWHKFNGSQITDNTILSLYRDGTDLLKELNIEMKTGNPLTDDEDHFFMAEWPYLSFYDRSWTPDYNGGYLGSYALPLKEHKETPFRIDWVDDSKLQHILTKAILKHSRPVTDKRFILKDDVESAMETIAEYAFYELNAPYHSLNNKYADLYGVSAAESEVFLYNIDIAVRKSKRSDGDFFDSVYEWETDSRYPDDVWQIERGYVDFFAYNNGTEAKIGSYNIWDKQYSGPGDENEKDHFACVVSGPSHDGISIDSEEAEKTIQLLIDRYNSMNLGPKMSHEDRTAGKPPRLVPDEMRKKHAEMYKQCTMREAKENTSGIVNGSKAIPVSPSHTPISGYFDGNTDGHGGGMGGR